ncbi:MAG: hypothetical protein RLZZ324_391 [Candidatus Parcubacteria bacterium]|jgi:hypothetical protein
MFLVVHAAIGALVGNSVSSPVAAFSLGVISHFFSDMVPHGDTHMYAGYKSGERVTAALLYVGGDALATVIMLLTLFLSQDFTSTRNVALGVLGGLLPDLLAGLFEVLKPKKRNWIHLQLGKFHGFHMKNHNFIIHNARHDKDIPMRYGLLLQSVVLTSLLIMIF